MNEWKDFDRPVGPILRFLAGFYALCGLLMIIIDIYLAARLWVEGIFRAPAIVVVVVTFGSCLCVAYLFGYVALTRRWPSRMARRAAEERAKAERRFEEQFGKHTGTE